MDEHEQLKKLHKEGKRLVDEKQRLYYKKVLSGVIQKKFKTTMIGALASFEESFGHLWGHGKHIDQLVEEEVAWRTYWEKTRNDILNKGHTQLRAALEELNEYDIDRKKYITQLVVKQMRNEND